MDEKSERAAHFLADFFAIIAQLNSCVILLELPIESLFHVSHKH